jgi:hypothetical protein
MVQDAAPGDEKAKDGKAKLRTRLRGLLFANIRSEILAAGSGTRIRSLNKRQSSVNLILIPIDTY